jgi:hypothetical protein
MKKTILLLAGVVLMCYAGHAAQMVFIDDIVTWTKSGYDYPKQLGDTNWVTPNYKDGKIMVRYEPIVKPSTKTIALQLCFWQDGYKKESCSSCQTYSEKKVYYFDFGRPSGWWGSIDYTRPMIMYLMHKDGSCGSRILMTSACGSACYTKSDIDSHVPITYKMLAVVVSAGSSFQPPEGWNSPITVAAPEFSKPGGTYSERFYLELSCPTPDARIFYSSSTTDVTVGNNPYLRPIGIGSKRTVSARAFKSGYYSPVKTMAYDVQMTGMQNAPFGRAQGKDCKLRNSTAAYYSNRVYDISGKPVANEKQKDTGIYLEFDGSAITRVLVIK